MVKNTTLSGDRARRLVLYGQLLDGRTRLPRGKEGVARVIEKLGYIQLDTIAVVERAHHHTLWTRRPDYRQDYIHELLAKDRRIFEYWGHAASYLPMSDYRFYLPRMRNFEFLRSSWVQKWLKQHNSILKEIKARIQQEGPLSSKDFKPPPGTRRGAWWGWKPAKFALEILFWRGELMIKERRKFERIYDLTERVLPPDVDTAMPTDSELGRFLVRRALQSYGLVREREIVDHIKAPNRKVIVTALKDMLEGEETSKVQLEGYDKSEYYVLPEYLEKAAKLRKKSSQLYILSPFDNLVIQRERLNRLFDFDYTLECYVPAPKRKYGYFVMPLLWGEKFVGRLDPKADRKNRKLVIKKLIFENSFSAYEELLPQLADKLKGLAEFNECDEVVILKVVPSKIEKSLQSFLK